MKGSVVLPRLAGVIGNGGKNCSKSCRNGNLAREIEIRMKDFIAVIATELRAQNLNVGFCESEED